MAGERAFRATGSTERRRPRDVGAGEARNAIDAKNAADPADARVDVDACDGTDTGERQ